jgi:hypothetical protein
MMGPGWGRGGGENPLVCVCHLGQPPLSKKHCEESRECLSPFYQADNLPCMMSNISPRHHTISPTPREAGPNPLKNTRRWHTHRASTRAALDIFLPSAAHTALLDNLSHLLSVLTKKTHHTLNNNNNSPSCGAQGRREQHAQGLPQCLRGACCALSRLHPPPTHTHLQAKTPSDCSLMSFDRL